MHEWDRTALNEIVQLVGYTCKQRDTHTSYDKCRKHFVACEMNYAEVVIVVGNWNRSLIRRPTLLCTWCRGAVVRNT